jgi:CRISPR-associated protein (TIGR03984 family)
MNSDIHIHPAIVESIATDNIGDVKEWFGEQARAHYLKWLLAHADDGVIWGKLEDNGPLITSYDAAQGHPTAQGICPALRNETLQQARLFSEYAELLLWRNGDNIWQARLIREAKNDESAAWNESIDEPQILWGTEPQLLKHGFTLMSDGAQGLRHAVPIEVKETYDERGERTRPLRLWVRHYIAEDGSGFTRIVASRLFDLIGEAK